MNTTSPVRTLTFLGLALLLSVAARAQEEQPIMPAHNPSSTEERETGPDLSTSTEDRFQMATDVDTRQARPAASINGTKERDQDKSKGRPADAAKREKDDALSFNFLYYIIQKFKIADLIEN